MNHNHKMLKPLTDSQKKNIDNIMCRMTLYEKAAHVLCPEIWNVTAESAKKAGEIIEKYPVGAIFLAYGKKEDYRAVAEAIKNKIDTPPVICADLVHGAGSRITDGVLFPWIMAAGAANSEELAEKMGIATAKEGRSCGVAWTFGPVVDLNINFHNPLMHSRAFGEDPDHVLRMSKACIRGIQSEGYMAATAKHFPGDGIDGRDSHICTSVNSLSRKNWEKSYGKVWRGVIEDGVMSIMSGHISLPFIDPEIDYSGALPATLSKKIQIDFLRNELGFKGTIISDAVCMVGFTSRLPRSKRAVENIRAGSDMVLFAKPEEDIPFIIDAIQNKTLSEERLTDAVKHVLELKARVGVLENSSNPKVTDEDIHTYNLWADEIGAKSISIVRNEDNLIPVPIKKGAKVLTVTVQSDRELRGVIQELTVIDEELRKNGFEVDHLKHPEGPELVKVASKYDAVFMNTNCPPRYGTTFFDPYSIAPCWDSFWPGHPCVIWTAFCNPYKIYEMPYVSNMINTYSNTPSSQRAVVKVWLGQAKAIGKSPISLEGFFKCEV